MEEKIKSTVYIFSAREVINKSVKLVYCVKKSPSFSKTPAEKKPPASVIQTLHVYFTSKQRGHDVCAYSPRRFNTEHMQCIYRTKTII